MRSRGMRHRSGRDSPAELANRERFPNVNRRASHAVVNDAHAHDRTGADPLYPNLRSYCDSNPKPLAN